MLNTILKRVMLHKRVRGWLTDGNVIGEGANWPNWT